MGKRIFDFIAKLILLVIDKLL